MTFTSRLPPLLPTCLPVYLPQRQLNPPCVAAWWGSSCLWPLYAKRGISHQLASTDTPAVWGRLMPTRDTLLFSLSPPLFLSLSLSVFLPLQPATQLIVCCVPPSSPSIALSLPPLPLSLARVTDVERYMIWRGEMVSGCVFKCVSA